MARILCLGDSPYRKTGFGVVNDVAVRTLLDLGHEVIVLGAQDGVIDRVPYGPRMTWVPTHDGNTAGSDDMMGWNKVDSVADRYRPDAVHIIGDAAMLATWIQRDSIKNRTGMFYVPIEGEPMNLLWIDGFKAASGYQLVTCSDYGVKVLRDAGFEAKMAYHGVADEFRPISPEKRAEWRYRLSWDDKFVVMCVAQNVGRKQWPRLFEAIGIAAKSVPNLVLYAHTVPFNGYWLDGHDLPQLALQMGVSDYIYFPPTHGKHNDAMTLGGSDELPGLIDLYGVADLFVLPSQVEGFGLPLAEAMACGLPVAHTDYAAGAEVIDGAGIKLPVTDWMTHRSHSRYANVAPRDIATAIVKVARSPEYRSQLSRRSLEKSRLFTWDAYRAVLKECFGAAETNPARREESRPAEARAEAITFA